MNAMPSKPDASAASGALDDRFVRHPHLREEEVETRAHGRAHSTGPFAASTARRR